MLRSVLFLLLALSTLAFAKDDELKKGSYYTHGQVGFKSIKEKGGQLSIRFQPKDEQFYWCPGVRIKDTKKATILTFVRSKTSQNASVDKPAKIGKRLARTLTIPTGGKDVFVRNSSNNYRRIYKTPDSKLPDEITISTKTKSVKGKAKPTGKSGSKGNTRTVPLILRPAKKII